MTTTAETRTVGLYNLFDGARAVGNGWLVTVRRPGYQEHVRFGRDETAARAYAAEVQS